MKKSLKVIRIGMCVGALGVGLFTYESVQTHASVKIEQTTNTNQVKEVSISQLAPNVWMHTSIGVVEGNRIPANGLILETSKGLVLVDTPWNDDLTKQLLQMIKKQFPKKEITDAIVTHAHDDRIGGIKTLSQKGVKVHSTMLTADLAKQKGFDRPLGDLKELTDMKFGDIDVATFYPGKGHTEDNIIVWLPQYKILFGGCLIKSLDTKEIVQTPGSYITDWSQSINKLSQKYNDIRVVVPGHGDPGDISLLTHTLDLIRNKQ
ncbi:subclass B1 metallo-beta-lactamase (plasmid) [Bacillus mycoides]|nr:subclass B1 metallo-beta-lactamase [Bacillus mycoides]